MQNDYQIKINNALNGLSTKKSVSAGLLVCNTLLEYMGIETKGVEDIELSKLKLPNAERYDRWFVAHPHFRGDRACFELTQKEAALEAKFFALQKRSKLFIAGAVNFTPNFEDRDYTRSDPDMKVGIDFFFTPEKDSVIVVLSNKGSLRLVELSDRLTNTQNEIFTLWHNIGQTTDKNILHATIWESFKLSSLNKKFYEGIVNSFTSLTQHLQKNKVAEQLANQFANRLHGRLLFLWFLRKKEIINETKEYFTLGDQNDTKYYANTLSSLFFNVLNNEDHKDVDPVTPYLNGGLFDQNADGEYWNTHKPTFPTGFFKTLYDHFDSFNFTTDESTPEYEQIAIDPEMLGRIFESFLATLVTETGAQAKKANGAFYTPREIVSYMSRESLRQYLYTTLGSNLFIKKSIDELLDRSDSEWALAGTNSKRDVVAKEDRERIMDALRAVRVLDPAVGSGAFPMGVLHKMLSLFERLDPSFDSYETKLSILKNNIYGVDIDPTAIEISRLRAWLSIIVDVKDIKKIKPLPNLDFKFVCANSLVGLDTSKQMSLVPDADLKAKLMRIRDEYYATSSRVKKEKLQKEYINLTHKNSLFDTEETRQLKSYQPFEIGKGASFYDPELMHGIEAFDVVIGNPPYISSWKDKEGSPEKNYYKKNYITVVGHYDIYVLFYEKGISLLKDSGILSYITSNKWMAQSYGLELRKLFLRKRILKILDFKSYKVFESATVDTQITILKNQEELEDYHLDAFTLTEDVLPDFSSIKFVSLNTGIFKNTEQVNFKIELNESFISIIDKMRSNSIKVEDICYVSVGAICHSDKPIKIPKSHFIFQTQNKDHALKPYIEGKNIQKWRITNHKFLDYQPRLFNQGAGFPELFSARKIVNKRTCGRRTLEFVLDTKGYYTNEKVNNAVLYHELENVRNRQLSGNISSAKVSLSKNYSYEFVIGVLNSKVTNWYFENLMANGLDFYPSQLRSLPIPTIADTKKDRGPIKKIETLVSQILTHKKQDKDTNIKDIENQIDDLVYRLYGLNEEEIKIIENSSRK
ncbi:MAG: Eco57I restriction-modification methylase domain-containing protein [bacterium]|nr:Eco57I restriction-modification methylase domain-containing protein [bacterium]